MPGFGIVSPNVHRLTQTFIAMTKKKYDLNAKERGQELLSFANHRVRDTPAIKDRGPSSSSAQMTKKKKKSRDSSATPTASTSTASGSRARTSTGTSSIHAKPNASTFSFDPERAFKPIRGRRLPSPTTSEDEGEAYTPAAASKQTSTTRDDDDVYEDEEDRADAVDGPSGAAGLHTVPSFKRRLDQSRLDLAPKKIKNVKNGARQIIVITSDEEDLSDDPAPARLDKGKGRATIATSDESDDEVDGEDDKEVQVQKTLDDEEDEAGETFTEIFSTLPSADKERLFRQHEDNTRKQDKVSLLSNLSRTRTFTSTERTNSTPRTLADFVRNSVVLIRTLATMEPPLPMCDKDLRAALSKMGTDEIVERVLEIFPDEAKPYLLAMCAGRDRVSAEWTRDASTEVIRKDEGFLTDFRTELRGVYDAVQVNKKTGELLSSYVGHSIQMARRRREHLRGYRNGFGSHAYSNSQLDNPDVELIIFKTAVAKPHTNEGIIIIAETFGIISRGLSKGSAFNLEAYERAARLTLDEKGNSFALPFFSKGVNCQIGAERNGAGAGKFRERVAKDPVYRKNAGDSHRVIGEKNKAAYLQGLGHGMQREVRFLIPPGSKNGKSLRLSLLATHLIVINTSVPDPDLVSRVRRFQQREVRLGHLAPNRLRVEMRVLKCQDQPVATAKLALFFTVVNLDGSSTGIEWVVRSDERGLPAKASKTLRLLLSDETCVVATGKAKQRAEQAKGRVPPATRLGSVRTTKPFELEQLQGKREIFMYFKSGTTDRPNYGWGGPLGQITKRVPAPFLKNLVEPDLINYQGHPTWRPKKPVIVLRLSIYPTGDKKRKLKRGDSVTLRFTEDWDAIEAATGSRPHGSSPLSFTCEYEPKGGSKIGESIVAKVYANLVVNEDEDVSSEGGDDDEVEVDEDDGPATEDKDDWIVEDDEIEGNEGSFESDDEDEGGSTEDSDESEGDFSKEEEEEEVDVEDEIDEIEEIAY